MGSCLKCFLEIVKLFSVIWPKKNSLQLWHNRLGHININRIKQTEKFGATEGLEITKKDEFFCEACTLGKQVQVSHPTVRKERPCQSGEVIHSDVCGPMTTESPGRSRYFVLFKDHYSGYRTVYFLRYKSEVFDKFCQFEALVKRQTGNSIKVLHTDNGKEYLSSQFHRFLQEKGIIHELSTPYVHQQNGRAEREIRTIVESARTMLIAKNVAKELWAEAVGTATYVLNRVISSQTETTQKTAYELWYKQEPEVCHLRTFGCTAYMNIAKEKRKKLDSKSQKMIMVGYDGESRNYRLWDKNSRQIHISCNVTFDESEVNSENNQKISEKIYCERCLMRE